jgi:hypothetical protein
LRGIERLAAPGRAKRSGVVQPQIDFLDDIDEIDIGPAAANLALQRRGIRGLGLLIERGHRDAPFALLAQVHLGVRRHAGIEFFQPVAHGDPDFLDEFTSALRCLQQIVIGLALGIEIGGQVLVGIAIAIGALGPQLAGPQALAHGAQHIELVTHAIDPLRALRAFLDDQGTPLARNHPLERDLGRLVVSVIGIPVRLEHLERLDHRPISGVVGLESHRIQDRHQHAAVVMTVGGTHALLDLAIEVEAHGFELGDDVLQRLLAHHRIDHVFDDAVRLIHRGLGQFEQQLRLAANPS